jgi:hypothetical protein
MKWYDMMISKLHTKQVFLFCSNHSKAPFHVFHKYLFFFFFFFFFFFTSSSIPMQCEIMQMKSTTMHHYSALPPHGTNLAVVHDSPLGFRSIRVHNRLRVPSTPDADLAADPDDVVVGVHDYPHYDNNRLLRLRLDLHFHSRLHDQGDLAAASAAGILFEAAAAAAAVDVFGVAVSGGHSLVDSAAVAAGDAVVGVGLRNDLVVVVHLAWLDAIIIISGCLII